MANTTNFGWETPDDTDLVKDGAAAIRTLGSSIDTSLVDLKGGTTGQILSKASNTDLDYTWINNDQGDITAVNTTAPLQGGGTSGALTLSVDAGSTTAAGVLQLEDSTSSTSTTKAATPNSVKTAYDLANGAIAKSIVDAKGDIIAATAADAVSRLAVGANDTVLTADSSTATGLKWATVSAGGLTLISSVDVTGYSSYTISSIPTTYKNLVIYIKNFRPSTASRVRVRFNADSTANRHFDSIQGTTTNISFNTTSTRASHDGNTTTQRGISYCVIPDYANTVTWKVLNYYSVVSDATTSTNFGYDFGTGIYNQLSAITSLEFFPASGQFNAGIIEVYGEK